MATGKSFRVFEHISSEEIFDLTCKRCAKTNKNTEAVKFCLECGDYLCSGCLELHNSFTLMAGHLLEKAELTSSDKSFSLPCIPTERCHKHAAEIIKMYCAIHDLVACTVCITIDHKTCNDIHYIPNIASTLYTKRMNTDTITALLKASEQMKTLKEIFSKVLDDLNTEKQTILQAIQEFRHELNDMLDKLEQNTKQQLDEQHQTLQLQWQVLIDKSTTIAHNLQKQLDQLQNTDKNISQQFVLTKMSKENISLTDTLSRQLLSSSGQLTFSQNQAIKSCFEQLSSLGYVSHSTDSSQIVLYKVKKSHQHNVRIVSDSLTCHIWGSCVMDSGHVLLTDYNNQKVKLFATDMNSVTNYCTVADHPRAISIVSDVEAAVSLQNNTIQFVSISNGLLPTRILKMGHVCWGLAVAVDKLYITDGGNLYVHELNGNLLRTINNDQSGQKIFSDAWCITVSNNGNIHVADHSNGLITLDAQGQVLWKYSGSDLKGAFGVCIDGCGNMFVCGNTSHNVLHVGHDGQRLGELVNEIHGVSKPMSVLFDKKNCRLITSNSSDNILVFSL